MTTNPLLGLLGPQFCRVNGGALAPLRPVLRMVGAQVTDVAPADRIDAVQSPGLAAPPITASLDSGNYWTNKPGWFGVTDDFSGAGVIYLSTTGTVLIGGFCVPAGSGGTITDDADDAIITDEDGNPLTEPIAAYRKVLINVGSHPVTLVNFRLSGELAGPDANDPGMLQCNGRDLASGQAARLVWDPTGQKWLVNMGQVSGDYVTSDNEIVTDEDGNTITEGV